jgi:adenylosuccinate synthase
MNDVKMALEGCGFFSEPGFYAIVDGQYGSTGKGLLASVLAEYLPGRVDLVTSNAGPNSGHTSYFGDEKVVLRQLPTFAVMTRKFWGHAPLTHLNNGAIINIDVLMREVAEHLGDDADPQLVLGSFAAVVSEKAQEAERQIVSHIGSTGKGTGAALAAKVMRERGAVLGEAFTWDMDRRAFINRHAEDDFEVNRILDAGGTVLAEVSQGFSLSLNAGGFYPFCTSRDCTVMQAMSDANAHPMFYRDCAMVVRTFPIRVAGNSGPCYNDQHEIAWEDLGVEPEITTVTKKVRRVFTWSKEQFVDAVRTNMPGVLLVNFMNYLGPDVDRRAWIEENVIEPYVNVMGAAPDLVLLGDGPKNEDVSVYGGA